MVAVLTFVGAFNLERSFISDVQEYLLSKKILDGVESVVETGADGSWHSCPWSIAMVTHFINDGARWVKCGSKIHSTLCLTHETGIAA